MTQVEGEKKGGWGGRSNAKWAIVSIQELLTDNRIAW
jgi:hypothetical protein